MTPEQDAAVVSSLQSIPQDLLAIQRQLGTTQGVGIAALPSQFMLYAQQIAQGQLVIAAAQNAAGGQIAAMLAECLGPLNGTLREWRESTLGVGETLRAAIAHAGVTSLAPPLTKIAEAVGAVGKGLTVDLPGVQQRLDDPAGMLGQMRLAQFGIQNVMAGWDYTGLRVRWAGLADELGKLNLFGGGAGDGDGGPAGALTAADFASAFVGEAADAADAAATKAAPAGQLGKDDGTNLQGDSENRSRKKSTVDKSVIGDTATAVPAALQALPAAGGALPGDAWPRAAACYGTAVALGVGAHVIAGLIKTQILGTGGTDFTGIAKLVGQFAGFAPITKAVSGNIYRAYLDAPMMFWANAQFRPRIPGPGELTNMYAKRLFDADRGGAGVAGALEDYDACMAAWGFSDRWIRTIKLAAYREYSNRELRMILSDVDLPDADVDLRLKRMKYAPDDIAELRKALKRLPTKTWRFRSLDAMFDQGVKGFVTDDRLRVRAKELGLGESATSAYVVAVHDKASATRKLDSLALLKDQWMRDRLTEDQMRKGMADIYVDSAKAKDIADQWVLDRYHNVYLTTPTERAKAAVSTFRAAFIDGSTSAGDYVAKMVAAGMDPGVASMRAALDNVERLDKIAARFARYELPNLRDMVAHGLITPSQYSVELRRGGFPGAFVVDEVNYATAQLRRRLANAVRTTEVPYYKAAYVNGLIDAGSLDAALAESGLDADQIKVLHLDLDFDRNARAAAADAKVAREQAATEKKAAAELAKEAKAQERQIAVASREAARVARAMQAVAAAAAKKVAADAKAQLAAHAAAAAAAAKKAAAAGKAELAALTPTWPGKVKALRRELDTAYKALGQELPDNIFNMALDLEDMLAAAGGADPSQIEIQIAQIEAALAATIPVIPTPKAATS